MRRCLLFLSALVGALEPTRKLPSGKEASQFDYIIVGGGAAGCVLGKTFADAGYKTLVIERGDDLGNTSGVNDGGRKGLAPVVTTSGVYTAVGNSLGGAAGAGLWVEENDEWWNAMLEKVLINQKDEYGIPMPKKLPQQWKSWASRRLDSILWVRERMAKLPDVGNEYLPMKEFMNDHFGVPRGYQPNIESGSWWSSWTRAGMAQDIVKDSDAYVLTGWTVDKVVPKRAYVPKSTDPKDPDSVHTVQCVEIRPTTDVDILGINGHIPFNPNTTASAQISLESARNHLNWLMETQRPNLYMDVLSSTPSDDMENVNKRICVRAGGEIIVSAGTILTPWLLYNSGLGPKKFVERRGAPLYKEIEWIGQNYQDRPVVGLVVGIVGDPGKDVGQHVSLALKDDMYSPGPIPEFSTKKPVITKNRRKKTTTTSSPEGEDVENSDVNPTDRYEIQGLEAAAARHMLRTTELDIEGLTTVDQLMSGTRFDPHNPIHINSDFIDHAPVEVVRSRVLMRETSADTKSIGELLSVDAENVNSAVRTSQFIKDIMSESFDRLLKNRRARITSDSGSINLVDEDEVIGSDAAVPRNNSVLFGLKTHVYNRFFNSLRAERIHAGRDEPWLEDNMSDMYHVRSDEGIGNVQVEEYRVLQRDEAKIVTSPKAPLDGPKFLSDALPRRQSSKSFYTPVYGFEDLAGGRAGIGVFLMSRLQLAPFMRPTATGDLIMTLVKDCRSKPNPDSPFASICDIVFRATECTASSSTWFTFLSHVRSKGYVGVSPDGKMEVNANYMADDRDMLDLADNFKRLIFMLKDMEYAQLLRDGADVDEMKEHFESLHIDKSILSDAVRTRLEGDAVSGQTVEIEGDVSGMSYGEGEDNDVIDRISRTVKDTLSPVDRMRSNSVLYGNDVHDLHRVREMKSENVYQNSLSALEAAEQARLEYVLSLDLADARILQRRFLAAAVPEDSDSEMADTPLSEAEILDMMEHIKLVGTAELHIEPGNRESKNPTKFDNVLDRGPLPHVSTTPTPPPATAARHFRAADPADPRSNKMDMAEERRCPVQNYDTEMEVARSVSSSLTTLPCRGDACVNTFPADIPLTDEAITTYIAKHFTSMWHLIGTAQLGLLDDQFRLPGVRGMSVIDASTLPVLCRMNIQPAVMTMARMAALHKIETRKLNEIAQ